MSKVDDKAAKCTNPQLSSLYMFIMVRAYTDIPAMYQPNEGKEKLAEANWDKMKRHYELCKVCNLEMCGGCVG
ncbi:MAG: hypothetical protein A2751_04170 [Candidatus Doudnabacteria bacterium RIFCSPHIGHO2_01_FULL_46_14]|uniref:Uncharacterized protein n=1 Tax=Candidatus Doudnabacteria bacterium RIFCSPHIGHO2_01_FULL_46_14 TaxID=1817824 RepID=A0A1F5NL15_9BACT|nr:MAG: hypothetical protein A2751_04170 [Candidatus Doudnabacteria bacterium RIFCSPHIGHO2_01_FULL_46_14]